MRAGSELMGNFRACIGEARANKEIDDEAAEIATEAYDEVYEASAMFGDVEADRLASAAALSKLELEAGEARRRRALDIRIRRRNLDDLATFKTGRGHTGMRGFDGGDGKPPKGGWVQGGEPPKQGPGSKGGTAARFLELKMENRPGLVGAPGSTVGTLKRAIVGKAQAMNADLIEKFESKSGLNLMPRRAARENLTREAFGEDTGDVTAKAMARAWHETAEMLRRQFNAVGGAIGKMDLWGLPQQWDAVRVRAAGRDAWVAEVVPRLNRARMTDRATGQAFTDKRLAAAVGQVWDSIATGGADASVPGRPVGRGSLARQRGEERFLIFASADDWMTVQARFGQGDVFQTMMGHFDTMAMDIARMQVFGTNPDFQVDWLANYALREGALEEASGVIGAAKKAERQVAQARLMYEHLTGTANVALRPTAARVGADVRAGLYGIKMGTAILSEVGSAPYFGAVARSFSGLDRTGDMTALVKLLALPSQRAIARRSGFVIDQATDGFVRDTQDNLKLMTVGDRGAGELSAFARRLPAAVLRASFLTPVVAARKRAFHQEFMGRLNDARDRSLADIAAGDEMDREFAGLLAARGFTEADWSIIRSAPVWEPEPGVQFLRPIDVPDEALGFRLSEAIDLQTRLLTPESTVWTRAKLVGGHQSAPGTVSGEVRRNVAMLKGFTVTSSFMFAEEFAMRGWRRAGDNLGAWTYIGAQASAALIWLTVGSAVSLQLREMLKGNDPLELDGRFWGAAVAQSGGLGIFGDFLYASEARNGQNAQITALGPVGGLISDGWGATGGNVMAVSGALSKGDSLGEAVEGADIGRDVAGLIRNYNPLATTWWSRAAYSRLIADQVQLSLDPEAEEVFARRARRMERDQGRGMWWEQGDVAPSRAPDLANMTRDDEE